MRRDQSNQWQTVNGSNYGPTFGAGYDMGVGSDLSNGFSQEYSYDDGGTASGIAFPTSAGIQFYLYGRIEVFTISAGSPVPEPTTLALFGLGAGALALRRRRRKLA